MSNSLKAINKKISKRKQVYKPLLDNPFTNESQVWPHVNDQQLVWELLQSDVLSVCKRLKDSDRSEWPLDVAFTFNEINEYLCNNDKDEEVLMFACNRDQGVPSVLLQQVPLIAYMSKTKVTLIQLPRNSAQVIVDSLPLGDDSFDGFLMVRCNEKINAHFMRTIKSKVSEQKIPWLTNLKYQKANIKLVKTTIPMISKNKNKQPNQKGEDLENQKQEKYTNTHKQIPKK
ncbi:hypothetical protein TPHA_0P01130 [Tetrapisispora phaffii CBS 4417]|uniref:Uncharacterized protein n=1 Tax=Tetrapisispora phaffii (strain ATCC 24235 / CBS 4417 / NBRC 1672 / NRRL Y-8282 / UCD 70-5) TaxID=1071381 RepID=G8C293_TETPH|nr:hypothetical protein TPHA_0P01130 [Tetrapisispora phaffii CBS 4417]CCE66271.1 hypothetical protein TPHA_0P01130 [Tetrapisispora phaffii CBS 4417]